MADSDLTTMPPAILPDAKDEEHKRRLIAIASAGGMPPATLATAPAQANTRPAERSPGFYGAAMNAARGNADGDADGNAQDSDRFGHLDDMVRQSILRRGASLAQKAVPAASRTGVPATPSNVPGTATMPPAPSSASAASVMPPAGVSTATPSGAAPPVSPTMPPVFMGPRPGPANVPQPDLGASSVMPPLPLPQSGMPPEVMRSGDLTKPTQPPPLDNGLPRNASAMPPVPAGPAQQRLDELNKQGPPQPKWWQRALEIAGSLHPLGRLIEEQIPSTPLGYNAKLGQAAIRAAKEQGVAGTQQAQEAGAAQAQFNTPEKRRAYMGKNPDLFESASDFEKNDFVLTGKFPQKEPAPEKTSDKKIDEYTNDKGQRVLTFQRANGETYDRAGGQTQTKPAGHTSAFEAFAYGSPEEKKAAQDYIDLEKKSAARYKTPSEFDEKFRLFKEDPDTYKAMFGDKDKAGTPDRATATKMLNYFDKRRREVNGDFTLDENQKQEQLKDIENLEKPFLDAVQPGSRGGNEDRVTVTHPDGRTGTIPRSQIPQAKKKGYRVSQ